MEEFLDDVEDASSAGFEFWNRERNLNRFSNRAPCCRDEW